MEKVLPNDVEDKSVQKLLITSIIQVEWMLTMFRGDEYKSDFLVKQSS